MDTVSDKPTQKTIYIGVISVLMLLFGFLFFGRRFFTSTLGLTRLSNISILLSEFFFWLILLLLSIYANKIEKNKFLIWQETHYNVWMHIKAIFAIFAITIALEVPVLLVLKALHLLKESSKIDEMKTVLQANKQLLLFAALTAGVTEEFIFRGYLLPRFQIIFKNPYIAIALSSILFGLLHFSYGTIVNMVGPMILGTVYGYFYWKYRNIAIPIICHFLWDFILMSINIKPH